MSKKQDYNAALVSTRYVFGGAVGKVDLTYPCLYGVKRQEVISQVHVVTLIVTAPVAESPTKPEEAPTTPSSLHSSNPKNTTKDLSTQARGGVAHASFKIGTLTAAIFSIQDACHS